jgi:two-component system, LytTR family, response regulator
VLKTIIIDDEDHIRDTLRKLLGEYCPGVQVAGESGDVENGRKLILESSPDLVLMDVQINNGTGFDILNSLPQIPFKIIFITAFDKYAVRAFKFSAVDYLLKPVILSELLDAIARVEQMVHSSFSLQMKALEENLKTALGQKHKIILKSSESIHLVGQEEIVYCQSDDCYTWVYTTKGDRILVSRTLKDYDEMLAGCGFYRVHKSYLINLSHVLRFDKQDGGFVILTNEQKIPVSSRRREELLQVFEQMAR